MYFYYGIKHSTLEDQESSDHAADNGGSDSAGGNIELKVTDHQKPSSFTYSVPGADRGYYEGQKLDAFGQPVFGSTNFGGTPSHVTNSNPKDQSASTTGEAKVLFIAEQAFPTWDD